MTGIISGTFLNHAGSILVNYILPGEVSGILPPTQNYEIHSSNAPDRLILNTMLKWHMAHYFAYGFSIVISWVS